MNNDAVTQLLTALSDRGGPQRLLRTLGFVRPLVEVPCSQILVPGIRRISRTGRTTFTAWLVESRRAVDPALLRAVAADLRRHDGVSHHIIVVTEPGRRRVMIGMGAPGTSLRHAVLEPSTVRASDVELALELLQASGEPDTAAAVGMMRALARSRLTDRFFRDLVGIRDLVARSWSGVPHTAREQREALALLLLSRLLFLYFLQRRGVLDGRYRFLQQLLTDWLSTRARQSFYRARLRTLFFGVLNRRPQQRTVRALSFGELPYLNGGLFELHRLEAGHRALDLPDAVMVRVFSDLLEKYSFTGSDAAEQEVDDASGAHVDPAMLGRIFEGLMGGERRGRTGTFYTPAEMVDRVVCTALSQHLARRVGLSEHDADALVRGGGDAVMSTDTMRLALRAAASIRVLDPACGSGAFLLGAMARLARLRVQGQTGAASADAVRGDIVARCLHGVDLLEDAALICSLRLWLALVPARDAADDVQPLPNLDRRIRQGDALVDPLDIGVAITGRPLDTTAPPELRGLVSALAPASAAYMRAGPEAKRALRDELQRLERSLAKTWLTALDARLDWERRDLAARASDTDLFGEPAADAGSAARHLAAAERRQAELRAFRGDVGGARRLPFFSFRVHFAEVGDGFDLIISNPPWIRAHNWPPTVRRLLRQRYHVCAQAGWPYAARLGGLAAGGGSQVDLSLLFLERSLALLNEHGTLAMLLPAKLIRSLYAGGARDLILGHAELTTIEDHSLDHRALFDADAFTAVLVMHRPRATGEPQALLTAAPPPVEVTLRRAGGEALHFTVDRSDLPLRAGDSHAPWLLVPPGCRDALRAMQRAGPCIGAETTIRRGVMTGANDVLVVRDVQPKLGNLARIRTEGYYRAAGDQGRNAYSGYIEGNSLRPSLRGADVAAWRASVTRHVLWAPCNDDAAATAPPRLHRFLRRHRGRLRQQEQSLGALQRLSPHTIGHKVVWSDLASELRAAAVPSLVRGSMGAQVPVIPLNTVYFIATTSADESMLLAGYLNSLPLRLFARAIAERAKDAHFRFFAWTIGVLPLPRDWRSNALAQPITALARAAHARGACSPSMIAELDRLVAASFGLDEARMTELARFDGWLRNTPTPVVQTHERIAG